MNRLLPPGKRRVNLLSASSTASLARPDRLPLGHDDGPQDRRPSQELDGGEALAEDESRRQDREDRLHGADEGGTGGAEPLSPRVEGADRHDASDGGNAENGEEGVVWDWEWEEVAPSGETEDEHAERGAGEAEWHRGEWRDPATATGSRAAL